MVLPAIGTLSYNGFTFDGSLKVNVETEFIYDEAGRTVVSSRHKISAEAVVATAPNTTDVDVQAIRQLLSKPGGSLVFNQKGFGAVAVHTGRQDVKWGPKPRVLSWQPIGSAQAALVRWTVEVEIADCDSRFRYQNPAVMAFNYSASFSMDTYGFTTRNLEGYLQISQTRAGGVDDKSLQATADQFRHLIAPAVSDGFRRTKNTWRTGLDKNRLDFSIADEEIQSPNPFPEGVADISGTHDVSWTRRPNGAQLDNTIALDIRRTKQSKYPATLPWQVFLTILLQRRDAALQNNQVGGLLLDSLHVSEDIFGYASKFRATYRILAHPSDVEEGNATFFPGNAVNFSGLFEPIGTDWKTWQQSMAQEFSDRGYAGLVLLPQHDSIIDLCGGLPQQQSQALLPTEQPQPDQEDPLTNPLPPAEKSWAQFDTDVEVVRHRNVTVHMPLQNIDTVNTTNPGGFEPTRGMQGVPDYGPGNATPAIIQESGGSAYFVRFRGRAQRAGHRIPRPVLRTFGGQPTVEVKSRFKEANPVSTPFGIRVYSAKWDAIYAVANAPSNQQLLPELA